MKQNPNKALAGIKPAYDRFWPVDDFLVEKGGVELLAEYRAEATRQYGNYEPDDVHMKNIDSAFTWDQTERGSTFWNKLYVEGMELDLWN